MSGKIRWGLLATGAIAQAFARGVRASQTGELTAVGSRTREKAEKFGAEFDINRCHGSYEALLADPDVEAVYISTPHTPFCNPDDLSGQLIEQLSWLGTDYADIYLMHRDNPAIPAGKFIEVLNQHVREGRIRVFGGSNWSLDRIRKANAYARRKGLQGFAVISNNLALAEMVRPVWDGCLHVHDAASRKWLKRSGLTLFPSSSQARGFFMPSLARPDKRDDASLADCWYSDDNFKRQARAIELAEKYGVEPINIALAWVLCQPFPTFPLIGPRQISETRSCQAALDIHLTPRELKYLNIED